MAGNLKYFAEEEEVDWQDLADLCALFETIHEDFNFDLGPGKCVFPGKKGAYVLAYFMLYTGPADQQEIRAVLDREADILISQPETSTSLTYFKEVGLLGCVSENPVIGKGRPRMMYSRVKDDRKILGYVHDCARKLGEEYTSVMQDNLDRLAELREKLF